jgi:SAM-dependent methyltransferase
VNEADSNPVFDAAADAYDDHLVPAFFDEWAAHVTGLLGRPVDGGTVLDIGCGTGVLAPHLAAAGWRRIVGVDPSSGMLARARARGVVGAEWVQGTAADLPLEGGPADALASDFALMFMPDPAQAVRAMASAVRADGPVVVCTWGDLQAIPAMGAICDALQHVGGHEASALLRRAFSMGQPDELERVARDAGLPDAKVTLHDVTARFPGVGTLAQAYAGPLGLDDAGRTTDLEAAMEPRLAPFTRGGEVEFTLTGIIISGTGTAGA